MSEEKKIPESCWRCQHAVNCYSSYGDGGCKYRLAIENAELKKGG